jgi:hypothetical protein
VIRSASGVGPAATCDLDWSFVMTLECPVCGSTDLLSRSTGRRVGGTIGLVGGAAGGASGALRGATLGAAAGPLGALFGGLVGAAIGCGIGARAGDAVDTHVLGRCECRDCGEVFSPADER